MKAEMHASQVEQHNFPAPFTLRVTGRVKQPLVLGMEELCAMDTEEVHDIPIFCGSGTPKGRIVSCRGVLLEKVIEKADVLKEEHNDTKKMFIVASAGDGHRVVFSWQEIFNTPIGGGVMILIEKDGKSLCEENGCLELISAEDYFTGSRYVKGLVNIELILAG
ncbi:MAG: molybdopterin-dependent oxidoreductase [Syntrophobacteraceae bacterium]